MKHYLVHLSAALPESSNTTIHLVIAESLEDAEKLAAMQESHTPLSLQKEGSFFVEHDKSCFYHAESIQEVDQQDVDVLKKYIMPINSEDSQDPYIYWETPECPDCGERQDEPFSEVGVPWHSRCSNGHNYYYLSQEEVLHRYYPEDTPLLCIDCGEQLETPDEDETKPWIGVCPLGHQARYQLVLEDSSETS